MSNEHPATFIGHLEEFRRTMLWMLLIFALSFIIVLPLVPRAIKLCTDHLHGLVSNPEQFLQTLVVTEAFSSAMHVAAVCALLMSAPACILLLCHFIYPGLRSNERRLVTQALLFGFALFVIGVFFGHFIMLKAALRSMLAINIWIGSTAHWTLSSYISFCLNLSLAMGGAFELPVLVIALGRLGLVDCALLRSLRRHVVVGLLIVAMLLTPPDVITQLFLAGPLYLLYEFSILILHFFEQRADCCLPD